MLCTSGTPWFVNKFGAEIQGKDGVMKIADVITADTELVSLYFSAHWCPPCRGFTPKLAETYKKVNAEKQRWVVIFCSSDKNEEQFDDYFKSMPWHALPYADRKGKGKLSRKCKVQGIPMLVHLDPSTGKVVKKEGRSDVAKDPEGKTFPWPSAKKEEKTFWSIVGESKMINNDGGTSLIKDLKKEVDYIGLYFSAHWCPPCRGFTPKLAEWYKNNNPKMPEGKKFELIFLSSDNDESAFDEYRKEMPFPAREWNDKQLRENLANFYGVRGIPTFIIVDKEGNFVTDDARGGVTSDPEAKKFPWEKQAVTEMGGGAVDALNGVPCVIAYTDVEAGFAAMSSSAKPFADELKGEGDWPGLMDMEFIVDDGSHDLSKRVKGLLGDALGDLKLIILEMSEKKVLYDTKITKAEEITEAAVQALIKGYNDGTLKSNDVVM